MNNVAPKTVAELKAARDQFRASAERDMERVRAIDAEIAEIQKAERLALREKTLADISPRAKEVLKTADVTFFVNLASDAADIVASYAHKLYWAAQNAEGSKIGLFHFGRARVQQHNAADHAGLDSARASAETPAKDEERTDKSLIDRRVLPLSKKILEWNTPDVAGERARHYVVVLSSEKTDDNAEHAASLLQSALKLNPRLTLDVVVVGPVATEMPLKVDGAALHHVENAAGVAATLNGILKTRVEQVPAAKATTAAPAP